MFSFCEGGLGLVGAELLSRRMFTNAYQKEGHVLVVQDSCTTALHD